MFIGVSGGTEFESAIPLRHRRFTFTAVQATARAPEVASGRPAATDAARRTWPSGLPRVLQRQEPYKSNQLYIKTLPIAQKTRWWGFMAISAIASSLLSCKVEKSSISPKINFWPAITTSNDDLGSKNIPPIAITRWEQSIGLFREALRRLVSKRQGGHIDPPPC